MISLIHLINLIIMKGKEFLQKLRNFFRLPNAIKPSVKAKKPVNKVINRLYVIENEVKQKRGSVHVCKTQYVEYVEGTEKSYRNVLTKEDFKWLSRKTIGLKMNA